MIKQQTKLTLCLLLMAAILLSCTACVAKVQAADLMEGVKPTTTSTAPAQPTAAQQAANVDFSLRLFRAASESGKNTLISPLSVSIALAMTANGAKGETLAQMEQTLGMRVEELNAYYLAYREALNRSETLRLANSIWFTADNRFTVNQSFLQSNANYYGAGAFQAPFDDTTLQDINNWVKEKTNGMIPEILDEIPADAVMYLVNALAFEANWAEEYEKSDIQSGTFTCANGTARSVEYLWSSEYQYLETAQATGFLKPYKDGRYAFAALLPQEGVSPAELLNSLDGASLYALLARPQADRVSVALPKFDAAYSVQLNDVLKVMGMKLPFDGNHADFSGLGTSIAGNIAINRVLHKTFLSVDENGTKAAAATVVEMTDEAMAVTEPEKQVILNRPFVYMLIDTENNLPLFIGTMIDPAQGE